MRSQALAVACSNWQELYYDVMVTAGAGGPIILQSKSVTLWIMQPLNLSPVMEQVELPKIKPLLTCIKNPHVKMLSHSQCAPLYVGELMGGPWCCGRDPGFAIDRPQK